MTNIFFRHSSKRCLALLKKKKCIKKRRQKTPGCRFSSFEHQITSDLLRLSSSPLNLCSFSSLPCRSLIFFFGWNMLQRLMILFRHILNYLCLYYGVAVWRERERGRRRRWKKKKCVHENQELHFKMLVFIALVSWTFTCGYTNVVFYMCLLYDDDDDQLVCLTFKWRHEFLPFF